MASAPPSFAGGRTGGGDASDAVADVAGGVITGKDDETGASPGAALDPGPPVESSRASSETEQAATAPTRAREPIVTMNETAARGRASGMKGGAYATISQHARDATSIGALEPQTVGL